MGLMKKKPRSRALSETEIDALVEAQANDDRAWERWVAVNPARPVSIRLSENTIASLKTLATLKKEKGYQTLLKKWIDERLIYEQRILRGLRSL